MASQVMTIVWNDGDDKPIITSKNIPGGGTFRKNEIEFVKKTCAFLEEDCKRLEKECQEFELRNTHF